MRRFVLSLLHYRKIVFTAYTCTIILMLFAMIAGQTTFDVFEFLPSNAPSVKGSHLLRQSGRSVSSLWVMMPRENLSEVSDLKNKIQQLNEIKQVLWIDNWGNLHQAEFMFDETLSKAYFSENKTLLEIQFSPLVSREEQYKAIDSIRAMLPPEAVLGGEALVLAELKKLMSYQPRLYLLIAILTIFLVLSLFLRSWKKPLIILLCMSASIILALGLASLFQSMSTITRAVTPAILMGITLDYSLFFIHRLEENKSSLIPFDEQIVFAMQKSFKPVFISALTTLTGLATLLLMNFGMGSDLGLALIRGVAISLLINLTLLPCLIYSTQDLWKAIRLTSCVKKKRTISATNLRGIICFLFPLILLLSLFFAFRGTQASYYISNRKQFKDRSFLMQSTQEIESVFGSKELAYIVYLPVSDSEELAWNERISSFSTVEKVLSYSATVNPALARFLLPEVAQEQFLVQPYRCAMVFFTRSIDDPKTAQEVNEIIKINKSVFSESYLTGPIGLENDVKKILKNDLNRVTLWSALLIALIVLLSFRSIWMTIIIVGGVQLAIWGNIGISQLSGVSLYQLTPIFISAIQMGATVDYGIYFASRFQEEQAQGRDFWTSMHQTWIHSFPAVFTSALILFSATIGISLISSLSTASQIALLLGRGALYSFMLVMFFLPLWLYPVFRRNKGAKL
jgi:uncharacterized protein